MLTTVAVSGYRSLRDVVVPLHGLDVVTGANGSGKSSLYRALRLLAGCGRGDVIGTLAREGGLQSALWAGPATLGGARREGHAVQGTSAQGPDQPAAGLRLRRPRLPRRSRSAAAGPAGARGVQVSAFLRDPEIKREVVWAGPVMRPGSVLVRRRWGRVETRAPSGPTTGGTTPGAATTSGSRTRQPAAAPRGPPGGGAGPAVRRCAPGLGRADPLAAAVGEHADRARRPGAGTRAHPGASDDPGLALLRLASVPTRRRPLARRTSARARRCSPTTGTTSQPPSRPSARTGGRCSTGGRRRLRRRHPRRDGRGRPLRRRPAPARHAAPALGVPSCPMAPCATCCSSQPCSPSTRRRCSCSTSRRPRCTRICCRRWPAHPGGRRAQPGHGRVALGSTRG